MLLLLQCGGHSHSMQTYPPGEECQLAMWWWCFQQCLKPVKGLHTQWLRLRDCEGDSNSVAVSNPECCTATGVCCMPVHVLMER